MRAKPVKESAVEKTIAFIEDLKNFQNTSIPISSLVKKHQISKNTPYACINLDIIQREGKFWKFKEQNEPSRATALKILDYILIQQQESKGIQAVIDPDWAELLSQTKLIADKVTLLTTQAERVLNAPKTSQITQPIEIHSANLFTENEKYKKDLLYLVGQLAPAFYINRNVGKINSYFETNDLAILAAKDLLDKLNINN